MHTHFNQQKVQLNGLTFNLVHEGPPEAPLIVLLHGFPECWLTWESQIQPLVDAGYRVIAPDQRGYNQTDKPKHIDDYRIDVLASDVEAIRQWANADKFHLVGHDWGAAVAWWYGMHHSDKLHSMTVINVPHPLVFQKNLKSNKKQLLKSWYMFFFQIPKLPESLLSIAGYKIAQRSLKESSNKESFSAEILQALTSAWSQEGAMTGMLNWYRAAIRRPVRASNKRVSCPTRILWGENDIALTKEMAELSTHYCDQVSLTYYPDATHWLTHDKPDEVSQEIIRFCDAH
jgi:pimeloyl-ACP methyl ester carboxylesterase